MANKLFFMTECKALKLPVPEFHVIENPHELKQLQVVYYFLEISLFLIEKMLENNFNVKVAHLIYKTNSYLSKIAPWGLFRRGEVFSEASQRHPQIHTFPSQRG